MKKIEIPGPEDLKKAKSYDVLKNLQSIEIDIVKPFVEVAERFVEMNEDNSILSLAKALSYIAGNHHISSSSNVMAKSL